MDKNKAFDSGVRKEFLRYRQEISDELELVFNKPEFPRPSSAHFDIRLASHMARIAKKNSTDRVKSH